MLGAVSSQGATEHTRIAAGIAGGVHGTRNGVPVGRERRLHLGHPSPLENLHVEAVLAQNARVCDALLERRIGPIEVEIAAVQTVVLDIGIGHHLVQRFDGIHAKPELANGIDARALRRALEQKQPYPRPQARIGAELQTQRLIVVKE
jgi:hypothetical protein